MGSVSVLAERQLEVGLRERNVDWAYAWEMAMMGKKKGIVITRVMGTNLVGRRGGSGGELITCNPNMIKHDY